MIYIINSIVRYVLNKSDEFVQFVAAFLERLSPVPVGAVR
jgi:hypothetical protein